MAYKIAIIVGSLREGSINRKVARSICGLRDDNPDCSMVEIGVIVGSLSSTSINRKLAHALMKLAPDCAGFTEISFRDLPLYSQDYDANPPEQYVRFREHVGAADGVLFCSPEYNRGVPGVLKNAIDVGSRPYGQSVFDKKPAAIVTASPGAIGGFGANHQIRQACVFLNMPVMQQPEAYLGHVSHDSFDESGCLKEGALKDLVSVLSHAFHDWVDMIHRSRAALAEDSAHAAMQAKAKEHA